MTFIISFPLLTLRLIYSSLFKFHKVEAKAIDPTPFFSSYVGVWCHQSESFSSTPLNLVCCVFTLLASPVIALLVGHLGRDECGRTHTSPGHPGLPGLPALRPLRSPAGLCLGCPPRATSWKRFQHQSQVLGCWTLHVINVLNFGGKTETSEVRILTSKPTPGKLTSSSQPVCVRC